MHSLWEKHLGTAEGEGMTPSRQKRIRALLRSRPQGMTPIELSELLDIHVSNVRTSLKAMPDTYVDRWRAAKRGFGSDWLPELQDAQDKLLGLARRGVANDFRFIVRGDELTALNMAMEIHDAQLEAVTVKELETAMNDVMENLRLKKMRPILETV
jgi:hypothetical protein